MSDTCSTFGGRKRSSLFCVKTWVVWSYVLKVAGRKMNYVISFIRNTLNAKYSGIQIKE